MTRTIALLDTVAVSDDLPILGLQAGEIGAVVELLNDAYEVEFCDDVGNVYGLHTLSSDQIIPLHTRGHTLKVQLATA